MERAKELCQDLAKEGVYVEPLLSEKEVFLYGKKNNVLLGRYNRDVLINDRWSILWIPERPDFSSLQRREIGGRRIRFTPESDPSRIYVVKGGRSPPSPPSTPPPRSPPT